MTLFVDLANLGEMAVADLLRKTTTLFVDLANLGEMAVADHLRKTTTLFVVRALCPLDNDIRLLISVARGDPRVSDRYRAFATALRFWFSLSRRDAP